MTTGLDIQQTLRDIGLLGLRTVVGATFLVHGVDKLLHLGAAEADFASLGIPAAAAMAPFVAATEAGGGALLLAGLLTRLAGIALAGDMLVALLSAHIANGFFVDAGGGEFVLVLGGASLTLALSGAGRFSVDAALNLGQRLRIRLRHLQDRKRGEVETLRVRLGPAAGRRW